MVATRKIYDTGKHKDVQQQQKPLFDEESTCREAEERKSDADFEQAGKGLLLENI